MGFLMLLMRVSKGVRRWEGPETFDWLENDDAHAMALSDLTPASYRGDVSFYRVDGGHVDCERVALAIAVGRECLGKVDYVLLEEGEIAGEGVAFVRRPGDTCDDEVNERHIETKNLSASKALALARAIRRTNRLHRLDDRGIARMIQRAIDEGRLDRNQLKPELKNDLGELL